MTRLRHSISWPAAFFLMLLAGIVVGQSQANRPATAEPSALATVNLETIFQRLDERSAADSELLRIAEELDATRQARRDELEGLREELDLFAPGTPKHDELSQQLARQGYQLQAFLDFAGRKLDVHKAKALRELYRRIKETTSQYALQNGYDVVFVDDSVVPLPNEGTEAETMRQISARRTLFSNPAIDVTENIINLMNDQFAAQPNP
ncbi:MAG: OmpH family outer membrane protein [Phycisphaerales bacterium]|nr:OmpH family outer membrane protein [Phycisphaerae bacterium]NNF42905.1 OmpH family outer membrane protein [Phycisphaerales bacterium]NNM26283.1 OmpH family outer membrane protein [Phycisphaerales bacterium]